MPSVLTSKEPRSPHTSGTEPRLPSRATHTARNLHHASLYLSRELSWLAFNERVLMQACDAAHPLLERVAFLAISAANLDEFLTIRVPAALRRPTSDGPSLSAAHSGYGSLEDIWRRAQRLMDDQHHTWHDLRETLWSSGIRVLERQEWTPAQAWHVATYFHQHVAAALTPRAGEHLDGSPGSPQLSGWATVTRGDRRTYVRLPLPTGLSRFIPLPAESDGTTSFALLEDVVREHATAVLSGGRVEQLHFFRVLHDAEHARPTATEFQPSSGGDEAAKTTNDTCTVQVEPDMPPSARARLAAHLGVPSRTFLEGQRLGMKDWLQLAHVPRAELKYPPLTPRARWRADVPPETLFEDVRAGDRLVHHPFDTFDDVETFLSAASHDPQVVAIKMTLYRVGHASRLPDLLTGAVARGKDVTVLVELKARLDERLNAQWARHLEAGGVHVVYGPPHVKTHAKTCLVVRREADGLRSYAHVATGNYNASTSRCYTDLGIFTADNRITDDLVSLFNALGANTPPPATRTLLVAPHGLRGAFRERIEREMQHAAAGRPAHIILKVNALTDDRKIRLLYHASQAGVEIDLIVRGMCRLRPGVPGVSDRIRVRSVVGRFLEHSRLYWFANGGEADLLIGSADLMERNLGRRVEILMPILDESIRTHLRQVVLAAYLRDDDRAMTLDAHGRYVRPKAQARSRFSAQQFFASGYPSHR